VAPVWVVLAVIGPSSSIETTRPSPASAEMASTEIRPE
jgi:hypothetical protein